MNELYSDQSFDISTSIFSGSQSSIYIANTSGLYHLAENSTILEKVMDGALNSMSLQSDFIRKFVQADQDTLYCIMNSLNEGKSSLFQYTYDPEMSTLPQNTVTVYSLYDSPTLRQAAALMQRENPNAYVEIRIALGEGYETLSDDITRSLNTELLNGKGPDILILDGLPKKAYQKKGILMNLESLFREIQRDTPLLGNISQNCITSEGAIYYMPVRFTLPVALGDEDAITSISQMAASPYQNTFPLLATDNYGNLQRFVLNLNYDQIFLNNNKELSASGLKIFWENVKTLGENIQAKVEFTPEEMEQYGVDNTVTELGNYQNNALAFTQDKTQLGLENIGSVQDSMFTFAAMEGTAISPLNPGGFFYPKLTAGINQNSGNPELAESFIRILYSAAIQTQDFSDGFAVQEAAALSWESVERDTRMNINDYDGSILLSTALPTKEQRCQIIELIKSANTPIKIDSNVLDIITEYTADYFNGKQDLETTVDMILNQVALYNEE